MFNEIFDVALGALGHMCAVEVADDRTIPTFRVYWDCILVIFKVRFLIELIAIPMGEINVVGIN